jgi:hypothetical protein
MDGTNNRDRFYDTESRNQKAVAADRKLPGTSPSTIADAIVLMTISDPMRRGMRITIAVDVSSASNMTPSVTGP